MKRSTFHIVSCLALTVLLPLSLLATGSDTVNTVGPTGMYRSLVEAVTATEPGGYVRLSEGRYPVHNLVIDKPLTIEGEGQVILDGEKQGYVLKILSDSVAIRNLEVHNSSFSFMEDYAGILIEGAQNVLIENVTLKDNYFGIYLAKSSDVILQGNRIQSNAVRETTSGNGIHLWYSKNITIDGNKITGHRDGIYFEFVEESQIRNNTSHNNLRYGLHFMYSDHCLYSGNLFRQNGAGVAVMYTKYVEMTGNRFEGNWGANTYGLLLKEIGDSRISDNRFVDNTVAIYAEATSRVDVSDNLFLRNGWAIRLPANSVDNQFRGNNFVDNTFEVGTNSRRHYNTFEGNYWGQYDGYDLDRDGIGDIPHHPVRLFSMMIESRPESLILLRSLLIGLLDRAERIMPALTPETLVDSKPLMRMSQ